MDVTIENRDVNDFFKLTDLIKNEGVRNFTQDFIVLKVPDYFGRVAASASGKYHPEYALGESGLIRHSMAVATIMYDMRELDYLQLTRYDKDLLFSACLLHDSFKQGLQESGTTVKLHPAIAAKEILRYGEETDRQKIGKTVAALVLTHMGVWGNNKPGNRGQFLVHLADYLASRKYISVSWDHLLEIVDKNREIEGVTDGGSKTI